MSSGSSAAIRRATVRVENSDQKTGVDIVRKAIRAPARQIVDNSGEDGAVVVGKLLEAKEYSYGYDAQTGEYGDLVTRGIIDPTKVVRTRSKSTCAASDALHDLGNCQFGIVIQNRLRHAADFGHLLTCPIGRPPNEVRRSYANFTYQAGSWTKPRRVVAKVEKSSSSQAGANCAKRPGGAQG